VGAVEYLLDTHTFLWALRGEQKLSTKAKEIIKDASVTKFVTAVSAYEIMYKYQLGKLPEYESVAENYFDALRKFGADALPINMRHAHFAGKFVWAHRDPFDRLLAAQTFTDNLTLVTNDPVFGELSQLAVVW
jgi:PIN domain nuclease of toxin-antitoxin system